MLPAFGPLLAVTVPVGTVDHTASTKVCTCICIRMYMQIQKPVRILYNYSIFSIVILTVHTYVHNCRL